MRSSIGDTAEELLRHADAAMYRAKSAGRDRWEVFDTDLQVWVEERREIETSLEHALRNDELRLVYQPVVGLEADTIVGFEALLRWHRPGHGLVTPDKFIALAEETGLIVPIGEWVLEEACRQLARWQRRFGQPDLYMSVNVSPRQLRQPHLVTTVAEAVGRARIDPSCLVLEITESMLVEESERSLTQLEALKRVGVKLALDDFGTGYSGLSYLRQFPVDLVKIDRSFIGRLGGTRADATVVSAIVQLAHALDIAVVAEGVETDLHLSALRILACDFGQGFLWARPMPPGDAGNLVTESPRPADAPRVALGSVG
jgi:EAL domain-containing protein (putative c-di-GMP-specific phosphodiesterase class I)